jgi:hypothetical protein
VIELLKLFKTKKLSAIILILFLFILFIASLFIRNIFPGLYIFSIFLIILIFILSQYLDFDYKLLILFAIILFIFCFSLIIRGSFTFSESFGNYIFLLLIFSGIGYLLENLRQISEKKGKNKIYRNALLTVLCAFLVFSLVIFVKDFYKNAEYSVVIKKSVINSSNAVKNNYLRIFNKDKYYSKVSHAVIDNKKYSEMIILEIDNPKEGMTISGGVNITGWAIEKNAIDSNGIDRVEFFLDGKPGEGKFLGKYMQDYKGEEVTEKIIQNLYLNFYYRFPSNEELGFWSRNLEQNNMSYNDAVNNIINNSKFFERKLSNKEVIATLYKGILNREVTKEEFLNWDDYFIHGSSKNDVLNMFLNTEEVKIFLKEYYGKVRIKEFNLGSVREDIGEKYGRQFILSGFNVILDSTKLKNGEHRLLVYAHSPVFGWDFQEIRFFLEN